MMHIAMSRSVSCWALARVFDAGPSEVTLGGGVLFLVMMLSSNADGFATLSLFWFGTVSLFVTRTSSFFNASNSLSSFDTVVVDFITFVRSFIAWMATSAGVTVG